MRDRIYWFQRRNTRNGELLEEYFDTDENSGRYHLQSPRHYKYIGWSDGRFIKEVGKQQTRFDDRGIGIPAEEDLAVKLREASAKELEFAKGNPDKSAPRDFSKVDMEGRPITDPVIFNNLNRR